MMRWTALALFALGCANAKLRGAVSVDPVREPELASALRSTTRDCRDERGAAVANLELDYSYATAAKSARQLIERRAEHDSVLVQNTYEEAGSRVFAYVSSDAQHDDVLHRIRLAPDGSGEVTFSRAFTLRDSTHGFVAEPQRVLLRCALAPLQTSADAAHGNAGG